MKRTWFLAVILIAGMGTSIAAGSDSAEAATPDAFPTSQKFIGEPVPDHGFGFAVSAEGARVVVGAGSLDDDGEGVGAVYVHELDPMGLWTPSARLTHVAPHVGLSGSQSDFGSTVAVDGDTAVVGAPYLNAALVYELADGLWVQSAELAGPDGFGAAVAVNGDAIAVGASKASEVRVFERAGGAWGLVSTLTAPDSGCLGAAVSLDGDLLAAGAPCQPRAIHVFERGAGGWSWAAELTVEADPLFGRSVDLEGSTLLGGGGSLFAFERSDAGWSGPQLVSDVAGPAVALSGDLAATSPGGDTLVFQHVDGAWTEAARVAPEDASPFIGRDPRFGWSVDLAGDVLVVSATRDDASPGVVGVDESVPGQCASLLVSECMPPQPGSVYVYERSGGSWLQVAKLAGSASSGDWFGTSVAIDRGGDSIVAGSPGHPHALGGFVDAEDAAHVFSRFTPEVLP